MKPQEIFDAWLRCYQADCEVSGTVDGTFVFNLSGKDGGAWTVDFRSGMEIRQGLGKGDCEVAVSAEDFVAISTGKMNPQAAFLMGRVGLSGDASKLIGLSAFFERCQDALDASRDGVSSDDGDCSENL